MLNNGHDLFRDNKGAAKGGSAGMQPPPQPPKAEI